MQSNEGATHPLWGWMVFSELVTIRGELFSFSYMAERAMKGKWGRFMEYYHIHRDSILMTWSPATVDTWGLRIIEVVVEDRNTLNKALVLCAYTRIIKEAVSLSLQHIYEGNTLLIPALTFWLWLAVYVEFLCWKDTFNFYLMCYRRYFELKSSITFFVFLQIVSAVNVERYFRFISMAMWNAPLPALWELAHFLAKYSRLPLYVTCSSPGTSCFSSEFRLHFWRVISETSTWLLVFLLTLDWFPDLDAQLYYFLLFRYFSILWCSSLSCGISSLFSPSHPLPSHDKGSPLCYYNTIVFHSVI